MPIHDLGYRAWPGKYSSGLFRFSAIASGGIRVVGRNTWVRRVLFAAWLPTFGLAVVLFGYERVLENQDGLTRNQARQQVRDTLEELGIAPQDRDMVLEALGKEDLREGRHLMWSWLLSAFLRVPQAVMAMLVIGMTAPPLISRDVRTRAFLLYFSKPIGRVEYVLGKMTIVGAYLMSITTVPALGCYLFGVALSSDLSVLAYTWDLPFRIVLASLLFIIPAVSVALMFSSLTSESRFAAFAWFAFWGLGFIAWNVTYAVMSDHAHRTVYAQLGDQRSDQRLQQWMNEAVELGYINRSDAVEPVRPSSGIALTDEQREAIEKQHRRYEEVRRQVESVFTRRDQGRIEARIAQAQEEIADHPMALVSMYDTLVRLQRWVFGLEARWSAVLPSMVVAASVTAVSWLILLRNVSAPIRI